MKIFKIPPHHTRLLAEGFTHVFRPCVDMGGWGKEEAENLICALNAVAPKWIEHCGETMKYVHAILGIVAIGLVSVRMGENGEWLFQLNGKGLEAGNSMGLSMNNLELKETK